MSASQRFSTSSTARSRSKSASSFQAPNTKEANVETNYILTLLADEAHLQSMNKLRDQYFPSHRNKTPAHITLFHALPGSRLKSDVLPALESLVSRYHAFQLSATKPFRMKRGIGINVKDHKNISVKIHDELQRQWKDFLSEQDSSRGFRPHYTIMNKVDDEKEIETAMSEVSESFRSNDGTVFGLGLWRYEKGFWKDLKEYKFEEAPEKTS